MKDFFIDNNYPNIQWGPIHLLCIVIFVIGLIIIIVNRDKIHNLTDKQKKIIRLTIASIMFINMAIYYGAYVYYGVYDWKVHLPFHFCFISGYLFMLSLFSNNQKIYKIAYFFAFMGPIPAIIFPDLGGSVDRFIFYQYFISHHFFLLSSIFMYYAYQPKMGKKSIRNAIIAANIVFITMAIFNAIFKTNYIMSNSLPEFFLNLYPIFRNINYPVILLEITGITIILIAYILVHFRNKELAKREDNKKKIK